MVVSPGVSFVHRCTEGHVSALLQSLFLLIHLLLTLIYLFLLFSQIPFIFSLQPSDNFLLCLFVPEGKNPTDSRATGDYGVPNPGPAFKEVWQVKVWPKGLGQAKNLVGIYRLCLTDKTVNFVKLNSDAAAVVLQLMNVRRCGHSENFFFVEVGRSAVTGPGEFWMQVSL